jgi:hypothetical protein
MGVRFLLERRYLNPLPGNTAFTFASDVSEIEPPNSVGQIHDTGTTRALLIGLMIRPFCLHHWDSMRFKHLTVRYSAVGFHPQYLCGSCRRATDCYLKPTCLFGSAFAAARGFVNWGLPRSIDEGPNVLKHDCSNMKPQSLSACAGQLGDRGRPRSPVCCGSCCHSILQENRHHYPLSQTALGPDAARALSADDASISAYQANASSSLTSP